MTSSLGGQGGKNNTRGLTTKGVSNCLVNPVGAGSLGVTFPDDGHKQNKLTFSLCEVNYVRELYMVNAQVFSPTLPLLRAALKIPINQRTGRLS